MKTVIILVLASFVIAACSGSFSNSFKPKTSVRLITTTTYPEFPDLSPVSPVNLLPWKHDVPRDMDRLTVKNLSTCINVPEEDQNSSFWRRCGENPILTNSNIFVGFDQQNWNIIQGNFLKLQERIFQYQQRIKAVNKQRQEWRRKSEEERKRINKIEDQNNTTQE